MFPTLPSSFSKYHILEEIHSGTISNLYKAVDTAQGQIVALKVLKEEYSYDQEIVKRFEREAKIAKELNHPNIIKVYDIDCEQNRYYFTMKFINGPSLRKVLFQENTLSIEKAGMIIKTVCLGLHYAHSNQVIHRDLKPSNIMIDENGNIFILDFGIAKIIYLARLTRPEVRLGTPEYMSPEQIRGLSVDGRTDLYSLGIVFFELITGTIPFKGSDYWEVAEKVVKEKPVKPSEINKEITQEIDELILKAIEKDRTRRFSTGIEMANAINNILGLPAEHVMDENIKKLIPAEDKKKSIILTTPSKIFTDKPKKIKTKDIGIEFWLPPFIVVIGLSIILSGIYKRIELIPFILIFIGLITLLTIIFIKPTKPKKYINGRLLLTTGKEIIQEFPLDRREITIGRDQPDGIEIFKDSISRAHAQIINENGYFIIKDLNSMNGTFVNGKRITNHILKNGDRILIGGEILIFCGVK